ncbi:L-aspartate oxidase [Pseudoscardovia radai]|uniref:L-aspartate oxidase n=1 Tax=Pseudoscardovia radai TaxID=987066 RepID=UPI003994F7C6
MQRDPIVVIGAGIAGISAALAAAAELDASQDPARRTQPVLLIGSVDGSNTYHAQGGIAAAVFPDDDPALHTRDTLIAGAGLCDPGAVSILTSEGRDRVNELIEAGVHFDRDADGNLVRGLEGAHSRKRILHAGGDATGRVVETDIAAMVERTPRIERRDGYATRLEPLGGGRWRVTLLKRENLEGNRTDGDGGERNRADRAIVETFDADRVILATGGAGNMYPYTTNPRGANANGVALALAAGAQVADLEFYQFHPTALAMGENFLISEAVRGEGAYLLNEAGERYMPAIDERAELAPRDIVARENFKQMMRQDGRPVFLDLRPVGQRHPGTPLADFLAHRFPTIDAYVRGMGIDWSQTPIPVTPAAHYYMGGVRTDMQGRTSLPGLYAAGECARTGVQGANRLASNSLLEGLVFGHRAGIAAVRDADGTPWQPRPLDPAEGATTASDEVRAIGGGLATVFGGGAAVDGGVDGMNGVTLHDSVADATSRLESIMWTHVGVLRTANDLEAALPQIRAIADEAAQWIDAPSHRVSVDGTDITDAPGYADITAAYDCRSLAVTAYAATLAALARTESRGAHARTDFPAADPSQDRSRAWTL